MAEKKDKVKEDRLGEMRMREMKKLLNKDKGSQTEESFVYFGRKDYERKKDCWDCKVREEEDRENCQVCGQASVWHVGGSCGTRLKPLYKLCPVKGYMIETEHYDPEMDPGLEPQGVLRHPYVEVDWRWPWADWSEILYNAWKKSGRDKRVDRARVQLYEKGAGSVRGEIRGEGGLLVVGNWADYEKDVKESLQMREDFYNMSEETAKRAKLEVELREKEREYQEGLMETMGISLKELREEEDIELRKCKELGISIEEMRDRKEKEGMRKQKEEEKEKRNREKRGKPTTLKIEPCQWFWNERGEREECCGGETE